MSKSKLGSAAVLFEEAFANAPVGMALVAPDGRWLKVNTKLCRILGYTAQDLLNRTLQDVTHPEDLEGDHAFTAQMLDGGTAFHTQEKRFITAEGATTWVELSISLIRHADGQPGYFMMVAADIQARKLSEHDLRSLHGEMDQRDKRRSDELSVLVRQLSHQIERRVEIQKELLNEKEHLRSVLENAGDAFIECDEHGAVMGWNKAAEEMFGWTASEAVGRNVSEMIIPERMKRAHDAAYNRYFDTGETTMMGRRVAISALRKDGSEFPIEISLSETHLDGRRLVGAFITDITERKANETELMESRARIRSVTDNMPGLIAYVGADQRYEFVNQTYETWFGVQDERILGMTMAELLNPKAYEIAKPYIELVLKGRQVSFENELITRKGARHVHTTFSPQFDAEKQVKGFYVQSLDITERKRLEEQLLYEATHDALTGLPNRRAFMKALDEAVSRAQRAEKGVALLFVDLDGFKQLNDAFGHEFGDAVLKHFGGMLAGLIRATDMVARLAGDEFIVLLESLTEPEPGAIKVADKILELLTSPRTISGRLVTLSASIGITGAFPPVDADKLLARADAAMYTAKAAGKGRATVSYLDR